MNKDRLRLAEDHPFTDVEAETVEKKANGATQGQIAHDLHRAPTTIRNRLQSARTRYEAATGEKLPHKSWIARLFARGLLVSYTPEVAEDGSDGPAS